MKQNITTPGRRTLSTYKSSQELNATVTGKILKKTDRKFKKIAQGFNELKQLLKESDQGYENSGSKRYEIKRSWMGWIKPTQPLIQRRN